MIANLQSAETVGLPLVVYFVVHACHSNTHLTKSIAAVSTTCRASHFMSPQSRREGEGGGHDEVERCMERMSWGLYREREGGRDRAEGERE